MEPLIEVTVNWWFAGFLTVLGVTGLIVHHLQSKPLEPAQPEREFLGELHEGWDEPN